jgi:hypothetical protein
MGLIRFTLGLLAWTAAATEAKTPDWVYLSSVSGALPAPNPGNQQTASLVLDIDQDGTDDFVVTERTQTPSVVWYKRSGSTSWQRYVIEPEHLRVEAGGDCHDIDQDGDLDIVFAGDSGSNEVWWWENPYPDYRPDTPWRRRTLKNSSANKHHDQIFGDFDCDGQVELVSWNQKAGELLLLEIPTNPKMDQEWPRRSIFPSTGQYEGLAKADINLDGQVDIVGAGRWFERQDDGRFEAHVIDGGKGREFTRSGVGQLVPGGRPEVVIVPGDADGPLKWFQWHEGRWVGHTLNERVIHGHSLAVADINGDGHLDIFVGEMGNPGAKEKARTLIYWGDGQGRFQEDIIAVGKANHESRLGDFDGDGDLDILGKPYNYGSPGLHVWLQNGTGTKKLALDRWQRHFIDALPQRAMFVAAGDLDGDGDADLAAGGWWWENPGHLAGTWTQHPLGDPLRNLACVLDVDRDGDLDVVGTQGTGADKNHDFVWARNDGSGRFQILDNIDYDGAGDFLQGCVAADLGRGLEIALSWHRDGGGIYTLQVPERPAAQRWTSRLLSTTVSSPPQGEDLSAGDIDRDGDLDLLLGEMWLRNDGDAWPTFALGKVTQGEPDRVDLVDVNGNGRLDATVSLENGTDILWYEAPADPTRPWQRHHVGVAEGQGFSMDTADFDRDGDPDIVLGEHRGPVDNRVLIFENRAAGATWIMHVIDTAAKSEIDHHDGVQSVDMDGDGDLDLISIGWYNPKVWIYENKALNK